MAQLENIKDMKLIRDRVYDLLRHEILVGGFAPGSQLNILNISKQMGVSCAPVREALNKLSKDGLVELIPYKKPIVADGTDEEYNEAFELRLMLEPYALIHAVDSIPDEEINEMMLLLEKMCKEPGTLTGFCDLDMSFHRILYSHASFKFLVSTVESLRFSTMRYYAKRFEDIVKEKRKMYQDESYTAERCIIEQTKEHITILEAVKQRDAQLAAMLLREHISDASSSTCKR